MLDPDDLPPLSATLAVGASLPAIAFTSSSSSFTHGRVIGRVEDNENIDKSLIHQTHDDLQAGAMFQYRQEQALRERCQSTRRRRITPALSPSTVRLLCPLAHYHLSFNRAMGRNFEAHKEPSMTCRWTEERKELIAHTSPFEIRHMACRDEHEAADSTGESQDSKMRRQSSMRYARFSIR